MLWKHVQHSFSGGRLDKELFGRQDLAKYFEGATELENFVVRRQGNLSKRRGTDLVCRLNGLFEDESTIAYRRLIPFVHEISDGLYLLFAANGDSSISRAYALSMQGLRHKIVETKTHGEDTPEVKTTYEFLPEATTRTETDVEGRESGEWEVRTVTEPFYFDLPYKGEEFNSINFTQSGDILFLCHPKHPPMRILYEDSSFRLEGMGFTSKRWKRPQILSVTGSGFTGTGSTRTIAYVCTYVKDGMESEPSDEFQFSYKLPWANGASVTIKCGKGQNETEPDHYNIYKSSDGTFGLVASVGSAVKVSVTPTIIEAHTLNGLERDDQIFGRDIPVVTDTSGSFAALNHGALYLSGGKVTLDFGQNSGVMITKLMMQPGHTWME